MNARRVFTEALAKADVLRRVTPKMFILRSSSTTENGEVPRAMLLCKVACYVARVPVGLHILILHAVNIKMALSGWYLASCISQNDVCHL